MATIISSRGERALAYLDPLALAHNLWQHRNLIRQFTRREVEGRYRGAFLGVLWSFVNPLVMLLIYTFVFGVVFQARWGQEPTGGLGEFALVLFCSLIPFNVFSECVGRASGLIVGNPNYVKKVVFPLEILPVSVLGAALFHGAVSMSILLVARLLQSGTLQLTLLWAPLVLLPLLFLALGLSWLLASLGTFIRDIGYTIGLLLQVLLFSTPIFYPLEAVPEGFRAAMSLNPLTLMVHNFRNAVLWGQRPSLTLLALQLAATGAVMLLGYAWFMKTKKAFADVL